MGMLILTGQGPRIMDSLEILSYCLHPETFPEFLEKYSQSLKTTRTRVKSFSKLAHNPLLNKPQNYAIKLLMKNFLKNGFLYVSCALYTLLHLGA